jgi:hypothetical protein
MDFASRLWRPVRDSERSDPVSFGTDVSGAGWSFISIPLRGTGGSAIAVGKFGGWASGYGQDFRGPVD